MKKSLLVIAFVCFILTGTQAQSSKAERKAAQKLQKEISTVR